MQQKDNETKRFTRENKKILNQQSKIDLHQFF